jgi:hypothetical protein
MNALKALCEKFKNMFTNDVKTVKQWEETAQDAMKNQAFPIYEGISSLHAAKKAEEPARAQERARPMPPRQPQAVSPAQQFASPMSAPQPTSPMATRSRRGVERSSQETSLAELMDMVRRQQQEVT